MFTLVPFHIVPGKHTVYRHHVKGISVLPARLQKPLFLQISTIRAIHNNILYSYRINKMLVLGVTWDSRDWQNSTPASVHWRRCRFSIITWPNRSLMFTCAHTHSDELFKEDPGLNQTMITVSVITCTINDLFVADEHGSVEGFCGPAKQIWGVGGGHVHQDTFWDKDGRQPGKKR